MDSTQEYAPIEIGVRQVKQMIDAGQDFLLLDCREPDEHQLVNIPAAKLIPMNEIPGRLDELSEHRNKRLVVHCHFGGRSLQVVEWLRAQGFNQAQNMTGGIDAWSVHVDPALPRY